MRCGQICTSPGEHSDVNMKSLLLRCGLLFWFVAIRVGAHVVGHPCAAIALAMSPKQAKHKAVGVGSRVKVEHRNEAPPEKRPKKTDSKVDPNTSVVREFTRTS